MHGNQALCSPRIDALARDYNEVADDAGGDTRLPAIVAVGPIIGISLLLWMMLLAPFSLI